MVRYMVQISGNGYEWFGTRYITSCKGYSWCGRGYNGRETRSKALEVVYTWLQVITSGYKRLQMITSERVRLQTWCNDQRETEYI